MMLATIAIVPAIQPIAKVTAGARFRARRATIAVTSSSARPNMPRGVHSATAGMKSGE